MPAAGSLALLWTRSVNSPRCFARAPGCDESRWKKLSVPATPNVIVNSMWRELSTGSTIVDLVLDIPKKFLSSMDDYKSSGCFAAWSISIIISQFDTAVVFVEAA